MPRLLLKLSGEALGGTTGFGLDADVLTRVAAEIATAVSQGTQLGIVLGGGNLFRGGVLAERGMDRVVGDRMGMLATVMNGLAFGDFLSQAGVANHVYSAAAIAGVVTGYNRDAAIADIDSGVVAILTGGTGNPYFTTDTAACLRGIELGVDAILKATNVDGIYDKDPKLNPQATRYDKITYDEILDKRLGVMDLTAIVLCKEHNMPLVVFDMSTQGALVEIANGGTLGTRVAVD